MVSTVVPRPIAWIVTLDRDGRSNAAPFSFFNAFSTDPPIVGVGIGSYDPIRSKDTRCNIQDTKEFVINLVSEEMAEAMNVTAINFKPGVSELAEAELETSPSVHVRPPRIAGCLGAMECKQMQIVELGLEAGLVLGRVLAMHVQEDAILDMNNYHVDARRMKLVGRMHDSWYARGSALFRMDRISQADWQAGKENSVRPPE
jgi:flavin reductase (DIM6/NTAB) family NADH-FMN oxidoreductase RutF